MYTIQVDGETLYAPNLVSEGYGVISPKLTVELNKAGSLTFILPPNNPMYDSIQKLKSIITVYQDADEIFRGRVLHDEKDFYKRKNVYCEGELAFLLDSVQRPYTFQGDIPALFKQFINAHNEQVEEAKQFNIGSITVTDPNNYINRSNSKYSNTWDEISDKLIKTHGGYLRTRISEGKRYIDLVEVYGKTNSQIIEFGVNMLDISEYITAEDVFTVLVPLGAEQQDSSGNSTGRLTIESVNGGKDYIQDDAAVSLFGKIWKVQEWDDVTVADNLLTKGNAFLQSGIEMAVSLTMKAIDLHLIDVDTERIGLGDSVRVISLPHGLDKYFSCSKIELNLIEPDKSEYTFGVSFIALTEKNVNDTKTIYQTTNTTVQQVTEVKNTIVSMGKKLNQEELFKILTNNGQAEGVMLDEETGDIYINASYIRSGILTIGGVNSENATLQILDGEGTVCVQADTNGIKVLKGEINATSGSLESVTIVDGITISTKDEAVKDLSLVKITEGDNGTGTTYCITIGEATSRSTPLALEGSSITIKAASGITFSADNIIFENTIEAPKAYIDDVHSNQILFDRSNDEKQVFFKTNSSSGTYTHNCKIYGGNSESKVALAMYDLQSSKRIFAYDDQAQQIVSDLTKLFFGNTTDAQKNIYIYSTDDATNVHKCKIYGGEGDSTTALGMYDIQNDRAIWVYNDVDNIIRSNSKLYSVVPAITLGAGAGAVNNHSVVFPFLGMCFFRARFTSAEAIAAGSSMIELGTLDTAYAPDGHATPLNVYANESKVVHCKGRITTDGKIGIITDTAISASKYLYIEGCWTY